MNDPLYALICEVVGRAVANVGWLLRKVSR